MIKILHCADLHLSVKEKEYGFSVLREIIEKANSSGVDYLLLCGDIFDSFMDAERLRSDFRDILFPLSNCEVLYLQGNHEDRLKGNNQLRNLDFGNATLLDKTPFQLIIKDGIEFFSIPHQTDYSAYTEWSVPAKVSTVRIAIAHGTVPGLTYTCPEEEEENDGSALDPDIFERYEVDYAALGHVHSGRVQRIGNVTYAYSGSARVWRLHEREMGPRQINLIEIGDNGNITSYFLTLESAGQYRRYTIPLSLEGEITGLDEITREWGGNDAIELEMTGIVEDENKVAELERNLKGKYGQGLRSIEIKRDRVEAMAGIASQPIAKKFLELWEKKKPASEEDIKVWMRARELALKEIKAAMQGGAR